MENRILRTRNRIRWLRWTARIWAVASVGLLLAFVVGEGIHPSGPEEGIGLLFFPLGVSVGMILAWRKEGLGGGITVASLLVFYGIHLATTGTFPKGGAFLGFAVPGFLFLLTAWISRSRSTR